MSPRVIGLVGACRVVLGRFLGSLPQPSPVIEDAGKESRCPSWHGAGCFTRVEVTGFVAHGAVVILMVVVLSFNVVRYWLKQLLRDYHGLGVVSLRRIFRCLPLRMLLSQLARYTRPGVSCHNQLLAISQAPTALYLWRNVLDYFHQRYWTTNQKGFKSLINYQW